MGGASVADVVAIVVDGVGVDLLGPATAFLFAAGLTRVLVTAEVAGGAGLAAAGFDFTGV